MTDRYIEQARRFRRYVIDTALELNDRRRAGKQLGNVYLGEEELADLLMAPKGLTNSWPQGESVKPKNLDELLRYLYAYPWVEIVQNASTYLQKFRYSVPTLPYGGIDVVAASIASVNEQGEPNGDFDPLLGYDWRFSEEGFSFVGYRLDKAPPRGSITYRYHDRSQPFVSLWLGSGWRPNPAYVKPEA